MLEAVMSIGCINQIQFIYTHTHTHTHTNCIST
jgi:hypothetical protein